MVTLQMNNACAKHLMKKIKIKNLVRFDLVVERLKSYNLVSLR